MSLEATGRGLIALGICIFAVTYFVAKFNAVMPTTALRYPWLPIGWGRRLFAAAIILFAIGEAVFANNREPFLYWLLLPFFSPRIVITAGYYASRLSGLVREPSPVGPQKAPPALALIALIGLVISGAIIMKLQPPPTAPARAVLYEETPPKEAPKLPDPLPRRNQRPPLNRL